MEVEPTYDPGPSTLSGGGRLSSLPQIDESHCEDLDMKAKDRLVRLLDQLESHVERLRKDACHLEEEKDTLLSTLDTLRNSDLLQDLTENEQDDIQRYADRISTRCQTVVVSVTTNRDVNQEEALFQVNHLIDTLIVSLRIDPSGTKARCLAFMNACSEHIVEGVTDKNFETALLGCTVDDQKRIKKRLQGLLSYMDKLNLM
ncbi:BAG family molecular chaperone regulator 2 isoform X2 [Chrysoperla carnea]|uniref:BAG family molecular chaperone regulator 2 isoform X2 n=1 Tax=Chrysoperla carnea TaxID=189513 RepID=UPI001D08A1B4|nr:BAG family molecular chaperone regulator 2 isoform X2 [Chrysoperla carnea]